MRHAALIALALGATALAHTTAHATPRRARRTFAAREHAPGATRPTDDVGARRTRMLDAFARSGHIRRCWMQQLQRDPQTAARTLRVTLDVGETGRPRAIAVSDPQAPALARCLIAGGWSLPAVGPGEAFQAEGTLHLDRAE